jgi:hypothetical protein
MRTRAYLAVLTGLLVAASDGFSLGSDHPKGPVVQNPAWPAGLAELFNRAERVHGFWVNETDVFFYAGDTQAFNQFLEAYAKLPKTSLRVVIHAGAKNARSPWDKQDRDLPIQWSLTSSIRGGIPNADHKDGRFYTRVDLWLGSRIRLEELRIPANVEAESGGEIERFIEERRQQLKKK